MKKINIIFSILFCLFITYSLINIKETNNSTMNTLLTFSRKILPALLPFLILNSLIIKIGIIDLLGYLLQFVSYPLFKISGKGAGIILISVLNGFPSSAIFTSLLLKNKELKKEEGQRLINSMFFPSLSFLFIVVNTSLNNNSLFLYLIISIYLPAFIFLYISSFKTKEEVLIITFNQTIINIKEKINNFNFINDLKSTILYSSNTLINILGILVIFTIPCNIINKFFSNDLSYLFQGLIEFSLPSINIPLIIQNKKIVTLFLATILSFSGLSSLMQATLFINDANLNVKQFILHRIIITLFSIIFLSLFLFFY